MRWLVLCLLVACESGEQRPAAPVAKLELVDAPVNGEVAPIVAAEYARAITDHKQLVVYVGASWCEPCRRFHDAAAAGQLDPTFSKLRLLVFDLDRDADALTRAGYTSTLIPLFALPKPDGTASGRQIEGSIKGEGAIGQITPRLQQLIGPMP